MSEQRFLDLRHPDRQPLAAPLPLKRPTHSSTHSGWTLEGQRRSITVNDDVHYMLAIHITAPDGRLLRLTAHGARQGHADSQIGSTLGGDINLLFRKNMTNIQADRAVAALSRLFTAAWPHATPSQPNSTDAFTNAPTRADGLDVLDLMQCAAFDLGPDVMRHYRKHDLSTDPHYRGYRWNGLPVQDCHLLHQHQFTQQDARIWTGKTDNYTAAELRSAAAFRAHGWTIEDRNALRDALGLPSWKFVPPAWATCTPQQALLMHRAGIGPGEAARLSRHGVDRDALEALAALRNGTDSVLHLQNAWA